MKVSTQSLDYLFLRDGTDYIKIPYSDIIYVEADGNYAYLQTTTKRFVIKRSLATIVGELPPATFLRASRGVLVNFDRVEQLSFAEGTMHLGEHTVKMGKAYFADIKQRMPRL